MLTGRITARKSGYVMKNLLDEFEGTDDRLRTKKSDKRSNCVEP